MSFARPPAGHDPLWPRASAWLAGTGSASAPVGGGMPLLRVIGVPSSIGSISPSNAWQTPPQVRAALQRLSTWDPVGQRDLLQTVDAQDLGDWDIADMDLVAAMAHIERAARDLPRDGTVHVFLGGDNAVTRPIVVGTHGPDLARVGVITLDAHHDVRHLDDGPRNGSPIRGLLDDGLHGANVVQIGIGRFTNSAAYAAFCREHDIHLITAPEVHERGMPWAIAQALERLERTETIHVDFDMDVLDVAFAPACPGARPGGLTPEQLYASASALGAEPRVTTADFVEVDAASDVDGRTVMATAMTLLSFAGGLAAR
ncbi:MAG: formiminoglutamase [Glaciecola sp.]|jgi:formiminoglutamase